jgi:hypothetical protein
VADVASPGGERIRAAEVIAALSLATDLGIGVPLEHGLQSTLVAMRLAELLSVDRDAEHIVHAILAGASRTSHRLDPAAGNGVRRPMRTK